MQFTGTELIRKRNFYTQNNNFGFAFDCYVDNTTGRYDFGISGAAGEQVNFTLQSGKMLLNGTFVHNYKSYERFFVEFQATNSGYNLIKNNTPLIFGGAKSSGDYSYFYMARDTPSLFADFNVDLSGQNVPNFVIDTVGYLGTTGVSVVSGNFTNLGSYPIQVFDSTALSLQGLSFVKLTGAINPVGTGSFGFSGDFSNFDTTQGILTNFNTNFDNVSVIFTIVDAATLTRFVLLQTITDFSFNSDNVLNRNLAYSNYSGAFLSNGFTTDMFLRLDYIAGSGTFSTTDVGSLPISGNAYGTFFQSGLYTGLFSGATTFDGMTGVFVTPLFQYGYAIGTATAFFSGTGQGFGTGIGYQGGATGFISGLLTGYIIEGQSGTFNFVGVPTGYGFAGLGTGEGGGGSNVAATGYIDLSTLAPNDNLYITYDIDHPQVFIPGFHPPIPTLFSNNAQFVANLPVFADAYGLNGVDAGTIITLSAITGGAVGNSLTIRTPSTNGGTIMGSNYTVGLRDYYTPQDIMPDYIGAIRFTGATSSVLSTGNIDFTNALPFNDILYIHNSTGNYYVQLLYQDPVTFITSLSGASGFFGINGVISTDPNVVNLTSSTSGFLGDLSAIYLELSNPGVITGSNYLDVPGNLGENGFFYAYTYNEEIILQGGASSSGASGQVSVVGVGPWTGAFLNAFCTGNGTFTIPIVASQTGTFYYTRTFTGAWDLLTGVSQDALVSLKVSGGFNDHSISGSGQFPPNNFINFQVVHNQNPFATEMARLTISGAEIVRGINQVLSN